MNERCPSTTVTGLLEAAESNSMFDYYSDRWRQDSAFGRVEWVGTMLGRLADRKLVDWSGDMSDVTITELGKKYLAWLRGGRRGPNPCRSSDEAPLVEVARTAPQDHSDRQRDATTDRAKITASVAGTARIDGGVHPPRQAQRRLQHPPADVRRSQDRQRSKAGATPARQQVISASAPAASPRGSRTARRAARSTPRR